MDLITLYILFAVTTGLVSVYELWAPVIASLEPTNQIVENKWAAYVVAAVVSTVFAPLVVFSCIVPSWGERFRNSLRDALKS